MTGAPALTMARNMFDRSATFGCLADASCIRSHSVSPVFARRPCRASSRACLRWNCRHRRLPIPRSIRSTTVTKLSWQSLPISITAVKLTSHWLCIRSDHFDVEGDQRSGHRLGYSSTCLEMPRPAWVSEVWRSFWWPASNGGVPWSLKQGVGWKTGSVRSQPQGAKEQLVVPQGLI